jgi:predicted CopG family antitoxin
VHRKLTISIDEEVYNGLQRVVGAGRISSFIEQLVRPHVLNQDLREGYRAMARDHRRERQAIEWSEGVQSGLRK